MITNSTTINNKKLWQLSINILVIVTLTQIVLLYLQIWHPMALISLLLFGVVWVEYRKDKQLETSRSKNCTFSQLVADKLPNSTYQAKKQVSKKCFLRSKLYNKAKYNYTGDSLISGDNYYVSNFTTSHVMPNTNNNIIVFDGIFAKIKTQNIINGNVIVKPLPVKDKTTIPKILQHLIHRYFTPNVKSTVTGNVTFDEKFEVFASSSITQSEVITEKVIENILNINETTNYFFGNEYYGMELSFINNYIFVGIKGIKLQNQNDTFDADTAQKQLDIIKQITNINKQ